MFPTLHFPWKSRRSQLRSENIRVIESGSELLLNNVEKMECPWNRGDLKFRRIQRGITDDRGSARKTPISLENGNIQSLCRLREQSNGQWFDKPGTAAGRGNGTEMSCEAFAIRFVVECQSPVGFESGTRRGGRVIGLLAPLIPEYRQWFSTNSGTSKRAPRKLKRALWFRGFLVSDWSGIYFFGVALGATCLMCLWDIGVETELNLLNSWDAMFLSGFAGYWNGI